MTSSHLHLYPLHRRDYELLLYGIPNSFKRVNHDQIGLHVRINLLSYVCDAADLKESEKMTQKLVYRKGVSGSGETEVPLR